MGLINSNEFLGKNQNVEISKEDMINEYSLVEGILNDEYLLVVGSSVILNPKLKEFADSNGDINQHIINILNKRRNSNCRNFTDIYDDKKNKEQDPIYSLLTDKEYKFNIEDMSKELVALLETKLFRFVLTTTIDGYLEALMEKIWGNKPRIVNILDESSLKDLNASLESCRYNKYSQPTLFYVFGHPDSKKGYCSELEFVETDEHYIKIVEKWLDLKKRGRDNIIKYLMSKRMLALGCNFDDWYFRFFWYIVTRRFGEPRTTTDKTRNILVPKPEDSKLLEYLHRINVSMDCDVWKFMKQLHHSLTSMEPDSLFVDLIRKKKKSGEIFISYKSANELSAVKLFSMLYNDDFNVWLDSYSLRAESYQVQIQQAIEVSKLFLPILSCEVQKELNSLDKNELNYIITHKKNIENNEEIPYYIKEWCWASLNDNITTIPIAIGGYDLKQDYHKKFEAIIENKKNKNKDKLNGIDMTEEQKKDAPMVKVGYAKLVDFIIEKLGLDK